MHAVTLLQKWFRRNTAFMHQGRQAAVLAAVEGLLRGGTLTLTLHRLSAYNSPKVRNRIKVQVAGEDRWRYTTALYREATRRLRYLGSCKLSHKRPYTAHLYLVRLSRRGRGRPLKAHGRGPNARRCRKLYAKRMQIEETFRDLKDERWGFGLAQARCSHRGRREVLLLIGALALLALWLTGLAAKACGWMRHYQANTERRHDVLSLVFLGREVLRHPVPLLEPPDLHAAFRQLQNLLRSQALPA